MRDAFFALILLASFPLIFMFPAASVVFWVWAAMADVGSLFYGFMAGFQLQKLLVASTVISLMIGKGHKKFYFDATLGLMLAFLLWVVLAQTFAVADSTSTTGWVIFDKIWKALLLALVITVVATDRVTTHAIILAVLLGLGLTGMWEGLLLFVSGGSHKVVGSASLGDNNQVALLMGMCVPLSYYVFKVSAKKIVRVAALGACVLFVASVIATNSRGGAAGLVVMALTVAMFSKRKLPTLVGLVVCAALFAVFVPSSWTDRISTVQRADQDSSFMGRVIAWKISTLIALDHPLTGGGLHAVQNRVVWDRYKLQFATLDFIPTDIPDVKPHAAHSLYFELLGDTGFPGLLIFLSLMAKAFANARAINRITRGRIELDWARKLTGSIQLSLVMFLASGAALSTAYYELHFLLMAVLSAMRRQLETETSEQRLRNEAAKGRRFRPGNRWQPNAGGIVPGRIPARSQPFTENPL